MKERSTNDTKRKLYTLFYGVLLQMLCVSLASAASPRVQVSQSVREVHISLELRNATLKECFSEVEKQTEYRFSYDHELIDNSVKINFRSRNVPVSDFLLEISKQAGLKFKQINNSINVQKLEDPEEESQLEIVIQGIKISGRVSSAENSEGLPGVSVIIKGTSQGTITDVEGAYTLEVPDRNVILVFSYLGFKAQEVTIGERSVIDVALETDVTALEEVVVVGYGTQKRSDLTGAIASVDNQTITSRGTTNAIESMQGSVAGVNIQSATGRLGDGTDITIRGNNTFSDNSSPLFVVDGVIVETIDFLNPQDIASIDVLKDASSAAIYGSRGSNGVIIVTTKSGASVPDGTNFSFGTFYGFKRVARLPTMMNASQWENYHKTAYMSSSMSTPADLDAVVFGSNNDVLQARMAAGQVFDWYDAVLQSGVQSNTHIGVTHRSGQSTYTLGLGYQHETGNMINEELKKYTLNSTVDQQIGQRLKAGIRMTTTFTKNERGSDIAMQEAFRLNPFTSPWPIDANGVEITDGEYFLQPGKLVYPDDGRWALNKTSTWNPLVQINNTGNEKRQWNVLGVTYLQYDVLDWLSLKSSLSAGLENFTIGKHWAPDSYEGQGMSRSSLENLEDFNYTWDNTVNFSKQINRHQINALALQSMYSTRRLESNLISDNQPFQTDYFNIGFAPQGTYDLGSSFAANQLLSYAVRVNYSFDNKYLFTASNRWDGSSKFAKGNKWSAFPSVAVAWTLSNESFLNGTAAISNLKLRAGYGLTGNNSIDPYSTSNILDRQVYSSNGSGFVNSRLANPLLTWEKTKEANVAVDFALLNNRIFGSLDWYNRLSEDLLVEQVLPKETGYESINSNAGSVRNKGVELMLTTINVETRQISWETTFTFTRNKNTLESVNGQSEVDDIGNRRFIGESLDAHYNYVFDGIWQADEADEAISFGQSVGQARVKDLDDNGEISAEKDRKILGSYDPTWIGGLISRLRVANFDFNVIVSTKQGVLANSEFHRNFINMSDRGRQKLGVTHYIPENTLGVPAQVSNSYPQPRNEGPYWSSIMGYTDASYVKVNNISLGYSLPAAALKKLNVQQFRIYVNVLNPFVFTDYDGWDPEWAEADFGIGRVGNITTQLGVDVKF